MQLSWAKLNTFNLFTTSESSKFEFQLSKFFALIFFNDPATNNLR